MTRRLNAILGMLALLCAMDLAAQSARSPWQGAESTVRSSTEKRVLLIGASDYTSWSALPLVMEDIASLTNTFRQLGFELHDGKPLIDPAERDELASRIKDFLEAPDPENDDTRIVYYAGHGLVQGKAGYLVPTQASQTADLRTLYPLTDLVSPLLQSPARQVLIVLDSCHSGAVFDTVADLGNRYNSVRSDGPGTRSRMFISSGAASQKVPDDSIFRRSLERLLLSGALAAPDDPGARVWGGDLGRELRLQVATTSVDRHRTQTPVFGYFRLGQDQSAADFVFHGRGARSPSHASREHGRFLRDGCRERCSDLVIINAAEAGLPKPWSEVAPFALAVEAASLGQWDNCFADGFCSRWITDDGRGRGKRPLVGLTFAEAQELAAWLNWVNEQSEQITRYRLPTEKEWMAAFLAGGGHERPLQRAALAVAVDQAERDKLGVAGLGGNVWEWTTTSACAAPSNCHEHIIVGGSFMSAAGSETPPRMEWPKDRGWPTLGVRLVRSLDP